MSPCPQALIPTPRGEEVRTMMPRVTRIDVALTLVSVAVEATAVWWLAWHRMWRRTGR